MIFLFYVILLGIIGVIIYIDLKYPMSPYYHIVVAVIFGFVAFGTFDDNVQEVLSLRQIISFSSANLCIVVLSFIVLKILKDRLSIK